jgi:glycine hydroxymethyltransferase
LWIFFNFFSYDLRLGSCALTSRGLTAAQFDEVCEFLHRGVQIGIEAVKSAGKQLKEWKVAVEAHPGIAQLRADVEAYSLKFEMPGRDEY